MHPFVNRKLGQCSATLPDLFFVGLLILIGAGGPRITWATSSASNGHCFSSNGVNITCKWTLPDGRNNSGLAETEHLVVTSVKYRPIFGSYRHLGFTASRCTLIDGTQADMSCSFRVNHSRSSCNTRLYITLTLTDSHTNSSSDTTLVFRDEKVIPNPPDLVQVVAIAPRSLDISWSNPKDIVTCSYNLCFILEYRERQGQGGWLKKGITERRTMTIAQLHPYTTYEIRIRTVLCRESAIHKQVWTSITALTQEEAPIGKVSHPSIETAPYPKDSYKRNVILTWQKMPPHEAQGNITAYWIVYKSNGNQAVNVTTTGEYILLEGLERFSSYQVLIRAVNSAGIGPPKSFFLKDLSELPRVPTFEYHVTYSSATIILKKVEAPTGYITSWAILWQTDGEPVTTITLTYSQLCEQEYTIEHLSPLTMYEVTLEVTNKIGTTSSHSQNVLTKQSDDPPSDVKITADPLHPTQLKVQWNLTTVHVHRYKVSYHGSPLIAEADNFSGNETNSTECLDVNRDNSFPLVIGDLLPYTNYSMWVHSCDSDAEGPKSEPIWASTPQDVPSPPFDIRTTLVTSRNIDITWSKPLQPNGIISHYEVVCNETVIHVEGTLARLNVSGHGCYTLEVRACNSAIDRCSEKSSPVTECTPVGVPSAPLGLKISQMSASKLFIHWEAPLHPNGPIHQYMIEVQPGGKRALLTSEAMIEVEVDCGQVGNAETEFDIIVSAMTRDESGEELKGDTASVKRTMCVGGGSLTTLEYVVIFVFVVSVMVILSVLVTFSVCRHFMCFRDPIKLNIRYSDFVLRNSRAINGTFPSITPVRRQIEVFDVVRTGCPEIDKSVDRVSPHVTSVRKKNNAHYVIQTQSPDICECFDRVRSENGVIDTAWMESTRVDEPSDRAFAYMTHVRSEDEVFDGVRMKTIDDYEPFSRACPEVPPFREGNEVFDTLQTGSTCDYIPMGELPRITPVRRQNEVFDFVETRKPHVDLHMIELTALTPDGYIALSVSDDQSTTGKEEIMIRHRKDSGLETMSHPSTPTSHDDDFMNSMALLSDLEAVGQNDEKSSFRNDRNSYAVLAFDTAVQSCSDTSKETSCLVSSSHDNISQNSKSLSQGKCSPKRIAQQIALSGNYVRRLF